MPPSSQPPAVELDDDFIPGEHGTRKLDDNCVRTTAAVLNDQLDAIDLPAHQAGVDGANAISIAGDRRPLFGS